MNPLIEKWGRKEHEPIYAFGIRIYYNGCAKDQQESARD